jgi:hypothetical protein
VSESYSGRFLGVRHYVRIAIRHHADQERDGLEASIGRSVEAFIDDSLLCRHLQ